MTMRSTPDEEVIFCGHPSWLSMIGFLVRGLVLSLVVGVASGVAATLASGHQQSGIVVLGVLGMFALVMLRGQARRMRTTYTVTDRRVAVQRGLVARRVQQARLEHVQDVRVRQSLLGRALGVGSVHFDTVGADIRFRGVEDPRWIVRAVDAAAQTGYEPRWDAQAAWREEPVVHAAGRAAH